MYVSFAYRIVCVCVSQLFFNLPHLELCVQLNRVVRRCFVPSDQKKGEKSVFVRFVQFPAGRSHLAVNRCGGKFEKKFLELDNESSGRQMNFEKKLTVCSLSKICQNSGGERTSFDSFSVERHKLKTETSTGFYRFVLQLSSSLISMFTFNFSIEKQEKKQNCRFTDLLLLLLSSSPHSSTPQNTHTLDSSECQI